MNEVGTVRSKKTCNGIAAGLSVSIHAIRQPLLSIYQTSIRGVALSCLLFAVFSEIDENIIQLSHTIFTFVQFKIPKEHKKLNSSTNTLQIYGNK